MSKSKFRTDFKIVRDMEKCIKCQACARVCSNDVHEYDHETDSIMSYNEKCAGCHFCEDLCPTGALIIQRNVPEIKYNSHWDSGSVYNIIKQAETGGVLLTGMGNDKPFKEYFDHIVLNASQVTNPSIDPLREPMELKTFIGQKPNKIEFEVESSQLRDQNKKLPTTNYKLRTKIPPQLDLKTPIMFSAMSYGSI